MATTERAGSSRPLGTKATIAVAAGPLLFFLTFFVWPVGNILWRGIAPEGTVDLGSVTRTISDSRWWKVAWFTTWQAAVSTLVTVIVGVPVAGVLARYQLRHERLIKAITTVPFVLPTVVVGTAFIAILDSAGAVGASLRNSAAAIIAAHVYFNIAVIVRTLSEPWSRLQRGPEEAARLLGRGAVSAFFTVTLPRLRLALGAAAAIVFLFSFTSFGVVLLLGGPGRTTLEVETYIQTTSFLNLDVAAVLAMTQVVIVVAVLILQRRLSSRLATGQQLGRAKELKIAVTSARDHVMVWTILGSALTLLITPMAILAWRSVRLEGNFTFANYRALSTPTNVMLATPLEAVWNSLTVASAAMVLSVVIGVLAAAAVNYGHPRVSAPFDIGLMLPLGTSAATLGFGFLIALDQPPLDLRTSPLLVPVAHALVGVPFVVRLVGPTIRTIDERLRSTALMLGQTPWQSWRRVDLPMLSRSVVAAAGFAFAISLGEFGATSFIVRPDRPTLPIAVQRYLARPGSTNFGQAMAMATILMVVTVSAVAVIESYRVGDAGEF